MSKQYVRVLLLRDCKQTRSYRPAPYYALPPMESDTGKRFRTKDGIILPQSIPPDLMASTVDGMQATHVIYTHNGRTLVREVSDKSVRMPVEEAQHVQYHFPGMLQQLPNEDEDEGTIGKLAEEKRVLAAEAEEANAAAVTARTELDKATVELEKERAEKAAMKKELDRLKANESKAKAAGKSKNKSKVTGSLDVE